ncbi:MAG: GNAT family N-acetyltransferase [Bacteroidales bacterium]|jgi:serine/threonine-protein kinase RsbW|nr:GNAT family N-acetyltransferase [Bacteroidales bacterium]
MGLPYDPSLIQGYDPAANILEQDMEGLGSFLIKQTMGEYRFNNLGVRGKEVVLIKYFDTLCIAADQDVPKEAEVVVPPADRKAVDPIKFTIRQMKPSESLEVCRCIYDSYGYSYANENVYFPERLAAMNQEGKLFSSVAVTPEGEVGGHVAIIFHEKLPAEIGIAVTKRKFRGQGFARESTLFLEDYIKEKGHKGMQVKEVTAHPYTQKFCMKLGYMDCGLLLGHSPKSLSFKGIADTLKQRNSDVLGFRYFVQPEARGLYVPGQHREMIIRLFNNLGVSVDTLTPKYTKPASGPGRMEVVVHSLRSLAEITIFEFGEGAIALLKQEMRKLFIDEIQVFELYLSLNDPLAPPMTTRLEELGFIFTGILPETQIGDALVMQYFNGVYIDYDQIVLVSELAQELLEYIKKNDPRSGS